MPTINRIRPVRTEKSLVRSYCLSVFLPRPDREYEPDLYRKEQRVRLTETPKILRPLFGYGESRHVVLPAINAVLDVPGVTSVRRFDYELQVTIAAAFRWSECHDAIVAALKQHLFPGIENVEVWDIDGKRAAA